MAGKNSKNPLLTGASLSFPFENFTNSALLVPVTKNEPPLIPEEIEADTFLGQEPEKSTKSKSFTASINKSHSSQSTSSESFLTPDLRTHYPSEPQLQPVPNPNPSPIPVFTQSFTGASNPTKPTPVYADAFNHQFSTLNLQQSPSRNDFVLSSQEVKLPSQSAQPPPASSLFFSNQIPSYQTPPTLFTPVSTTIPSYPPSFTPSSTPNPPSIFTPVSTPNPPSIFTPATTPNPSIFTPVTSNPSIFTPASTPNPPSTFTPVTTPNSSPITQNPTSDIPSAPPSQSLFNYFSTPNSEPPPPPTPGNVTTSTPQTTSPLQRPLEPNVPPPSGGQVNSYRLSNIKRPTYSRPPELPIAPSASTLFTMATPMASTQPSATLFTPQTVDNLTSEAVDLQTPSNTAGSPTSQPLLPPSTPLVSQPLHPPPSATTYIPSMSTPLSQPLHPPHISAASPPPPLSSAVLQPLSPASSQSPTPSLVTYRPPNQSSPPTVLPPSFANLAQGTAYRPVYHHWFFKKIVESKVVWHPFSMSDSLALEQAFTSATISPNTRVPTEGGRYDVEVLRRRRSAVYWEEDQTEVRRCSWFVKGSMDVRYVPYEESVATMLEEEYRIASTTNEWNRHVSLPDGEMIVIHSPNAIAHHTRSASPDVWGNSPQMQQKPRMVKRGMDEFDISDGEPEQVDHLLFLVHGIGKFCDLKFRPVTEVVDDFRSVSLQLLQSHFKEAVEGGQAGRVEVLPVSWHQALHNEHIDQRLHNITLQSIPRLRHFTNDTLLDILFYTSPVFCETIVQAVGGELNRLYNLFLSRNPTFQGGVSLGGHSLGSLILFDMLCNQTPAESPSSAANSSPSTPTQEDEEVKSLGCMKTQKARLSRTVSYVTLGTAGTGLPFINYPQLVFRPKAFFALGSPIGMFVTVRGIESLGEDFALPTCPMFFNIFHPFDPVAYRVESLINSDFSKYSPLLIPHHKGRKRMHLELKDTLEHVGTALKQKLVESVRNTWNTVYQLAMFHKTDSIEQEVTKVIEDEIRHSCPTDPTSQTSDNVPGPDVKMGQLNGGRRVDYVLQEAPLESFNEYLFALSSHVCYWESEDTMLMMLKEIYGTMGITPDTQVVHQILPYEAPDGGETSTSQYVSLPALTSGVGMDPTAPISDNFNVGPPPKGGFVKK